MILLARGVFLKKNGERYYPAPYMPIGSIYLTVSNDNPSKWFGGTWEKMTGGYLYAADYTISNSSYTGLGTQGHTLTINEMPSHTHNVYGAMSGNTWPITNTGNDWQLTTKDWNEDMLTYTGGSQAHSHNIAYIGVWCWKRIA